MDKETVDFSLIEKQFLCCTPMNKFQWNISEKRLENFGDLLSPEIQKKILDDTVNNELVKIYPIKKSYQRAFLKLLINELETNHQEVHDDLYAAYCSLLSSDDLQKSPTQYRHFLYQKSPSIRDAITLEESVNFISQGTTGLCTWQAGLGLAEWCLTNRNLLAGKRILELGCGVGFTGLTVVRTCTPMEYVFSDSHPAVLAMLRKNIMTNCQSDNEKRLSNCGTIDDRIQLELDFDGVKILAMRLPWEEINDDDLIEANRILDPDIILAADVIYDESCFKSLTTALQYLLKRNCAYAVVAYTVRNEDTVARFTQILGSCGLVFTQVEVPERRVFIHADETPIRIMKIVSSVV